MIEDLEKNIINSIIVKDISRLGREFLETGNYLFRYFPEHNIRFISILDNYDSLYRDDNIDYLPFRTVINDLYLRDVSNKIKAVRHNKMSMGLYMGSTVPYGYVRSNIKGLFKIDMYSSIVVKIIFYLRLFDYSYIEIAKFLTNNYILPPNIYSNRRMSSYSISSYVWKVSTVKNILSNKIYIGYLIQGKYDRINLRLSKRIILPQNRWFITFNPDLALVDKKIFDAVQNINSIRIRKSKYNYLFKGLLICTCGNLFQLKIINGKKYYICNGKYSNYEDNNVHINYRVDILNVEILERVNNLLLSKISFLYNKNFIKNLLNTSNFYLFIEEFVQNFRLFIKILRNIYFDMDDISTKDSFLKNINIYQRHIDNVFFNYKYIKNCSYDQILYLLKKFNCKLLNENFYIKFLIEKIVVSNNIVIYYRFNNE